MLWPACSAGALVVCFDSTALSRKGLRPVSCVLSVLLEMVASLFGVLLSCRHPVALRHDGSRARWCALLAGRLLLLLVVARSMLLFDLHCAGLVTVVGVSIFVL